jgi:hypothetical protein
MDIKQAPPQLPETAAAYLSLRKNKAQRTLNDQIEDLHLLLAADKRYSSYLYATYDEMAVEGSLAADNYKASEMIRDKATPGSEVSGLKLATINKALGVVLRRYGTDRKTRRNMVGGEFVPENGE